jgi:hypothetical protein
MSFGTSADKAYEVSGRWPGKGDTAAGETE